MSQNLKINYLELPARDLEEVEAFYKSAFGWTFESYGPEYLAFNDGAMDGGFYKADLSSSTANGSVLVVLHTAELDVAEQKVRDSGGKIVKEIFAFPGGRRFHFTDPNGNELAVWTTT